MDIHDTSVGSDGPIERETTVIVAREWLQAHQIDSCSAEWVNARPIHYFGNSWHLSLRSKQFIADLGIDINSGRVTSTSVQRVPFWNKDNTQLAILAR